jgi:hypothetical protein
MSTYERRRKKMLMDEIVDRLIELEELGYTIEEILDELGDQYVHPDEPEDISDLDVPLTDMEDDEKSSRDTLDSILPPSGSP